MTPPPAAADPLADAILALSLLRIAPRALGGVSLRGGGVARDMLIEGLKRDWLGGSPWQRLPSHIDDARLLGGVDIAASLASGRPINRAGLLSDVVGGLLEVPFCERLRTDLAGRLAQAMDSDGGFALLLCDDGATLEERTPDALLERVAFHCDLTQIRALPSDFAELRNPMTFSQVEPLTDDALVALAHTARSLGIGSVRALLFAQAAARTHAAKTGRATVEDDDLAVAARLVLAPRATRLPEDADAPGEQAADDTGGRTDAGTGDAQDPGEDTSQGAEPLADTVLAAARAAVPDDLIASIAEGRAGKQTRGGGAGRRAHSTLRGRPLSARPGEPRGGARLALLDTIRAAVPWQKLRHAKLGDKDPRMVLVRKQDLRIRRFEERAVTVSVLTVDASGSAAIARLAEAKGAVELILAQAYSKRSEVALIAFRGAGAELLLEPTRSLTRAKRALAELPGGGGTPLAAGLALAGRLGEQVVARGRTPFLVVLTDGSANIALDGKPGRSGARRDAQAAAGRIAASGYDTLVIDISPRPRPEAAEIAAAMRAKCLPLPFADARTLGAAVERERRTAGA